MNEVVQVQSSWRICETNSLGTDFDSLVQVMINSSGADVLDTSNFLEVVDMDNYLFLSRPEKDEERCVLTITATKGTLANISLVADARNIEIFIADSGQVTSYWKTFKGKVIEELSELGNETYMHEICFDCMVRRVELKLGKSSDVAVYLFGLKVFVTPGPSLKILPFQQNTVDFQNVETMLKNSNVPISAGAERALNFLKQGGGALGQRPSQTSPPNMEMLMNMMNQTTLTTVAPEARSNETEPSASSTSEVLMVKSYLDVRLKEMQEGLVRDFDEKLKAFEERQNQKFDQIVQLLKK